jgi:hypothetical protein
MYLGRQKPQETTSSVLRSTYTGNGSTTTYALPGPVANETSIIATINGVTQQDAAYSTDGSNIIFVAAPALGDSIEIRTLSAVAMSYAPSAGSVVTGTIADLAVTTGKINDLAVTAGKIAAATITQDKLSAGVASNGPAFSAYQSTLASLSTAAYTLAVFQTKEFDTAGCYNNTASTVTLNGLSVPAYSFCPNVAGYYQFNVYVTVASQTIMLLGLYKNVNSGSVMNKRLYYTYTSPIYQQGGSALIYLNGTGDYVAVCNRAENGVNTTVGSDNTYFQGFLVRAA